MRSKLNKHSELKAMEVEVNIKEATPTQIIDLICSLAKEKNEEALRVLVREGISIDTFNGLETAAQQLAAENPLDDKALELLVGKFYVNLNNVVRGAAKGGHVPLVKNLILRGATVESALLGAAEGGNEDLLDYLIAHYKIHDINPAFLGAAMGKQDELLKKLCANYPMPAGPTLAGATNGKNQALLNRFGLPKRKIDPQDLKLAISGAAMGGDLELLNLLLQGDDKNINRNLSIAVQAAANAGHTVLVRNLLSRGASPHAATLGAAMGGHRFLVEKLLLQGGLLSDALKGALIGGQILLIQRWAGSFTNHEWRRSMPILMQQGHIATEASALRFLSSLNHPAVRTLIAKYMNHFFSKLKEPPFEVGPLWKQANSVANLMMDSREGLDRSIALQDETIFGLLVLARLERYELPRDLYFIIITYISASLSTTEDAAELYKNSLLAISKADIQADLTSYQRSNINFFHSSDNFNRLEKDCQTAGSLEILRTVLKGALPDEKQTEEPHNSRTLKNRDRLAHRPVFNHPFYQLINSHRDAIVLEEKAKLKKIRK